MNIVIFEVDKNEHSYFRKAFKGHTVNFIDNELSQRNASKAAKADVIIIFIYSELNAPTLRKLPELKFIATRSTGYDHIDLSYCKKNGIRVSNVPSYGENTVAEHTFGLILNLSRKIHKAWTRTKMGDFSTEGLQGFDLKGKTLGVVGTGKIGKHVIRIGKGFDMDVLAYDVYKDVAGAKRLGFSYTNLKTLLKKSDVVSLHIPELPATHHLINKNNIQLMKKSALLINTSRGGLIETDALYQAMARGKLAGAGLDVLEEEWDVREEKEILTSKFIKKYDLVTLLENHLLAEFDNVIITPHNAFNSVEALRRIAETTVKNVQGYRKKKYVNVVR